MSDVLLRRGWCPGALRPMETGDGLLVRIRPSGGVISSGVARILAECAEEFGNGLLDLSSRANLQIRGVSESGYPLLITRLRSVGLIDADEWVEASRNIIMSPLGGIDPTGLIDARGLVAGLELKLKKFNQISEIPSKFGFSIDDGGLYSLHLEGADIRLEVVTSRTGEHRIALGLNGSALVATSSIGHVVDDAMRLVGAFLSLKGTCSEPVRRMAHLVAAIGAEKIFEVAGLETRIQTNAFVRQVPKTLGFRSVQGLEFLGVGVPFGRLNTSNLRFLSELAELSPFAELRLTPWRTILVPGLCEDAGGILLASRAGEFILDHDDPLLSVASCPGAPACKNGSTPTQEDARSLSKLARDLMTSGTVLHVSGCRKGCAKSSDSEVTLVGRDGRYDLVLAGRAMDLPAQFGMTLDDVKHTLRVLVAAKRGEDKKADR